MNDKPLAVKTFEGRAKDNWKNSEYSNKGSVFYISFPKWYRLTSRICRVKTEIHLMGKMGEYETLKLDSTHHSIGMTRESLDEYVKKWFVRKPFVTYWIASWNIRAA